MNLAVSKRVSRPRSFLLIACTAALAARSAFAGSWTGDFSIPAFDGSVRACAVHGGQYFVAGNFRWAGGIAARNVARWEGTEWSPVGAGLSMPVARLANWGTELLAATVSNGVDVSPVMRFSGGSWRPLGSTLYGAADALLVTGGEIYVAGSLFQPGLSNAPRVMRWDGAAWQPLGETFDGRVLALAVYEGDLYAAGEFLSAGSQYVSRIARWDGTHWQPVAGGTNAGGGVEIRALAVYSGRLIAGGTFNAMDGTPARGIAAWNGAAWDSLPETPKDCLVSDLLVEGSLLHVAGVLQVPYQWASGFATFDGTSWRVPAPYPDWGVVDIAADDGRLVAVGDPSGLFSGAGGWNRIPVRDVVVRDPTWHALDSWRPGMHGLIGPSWSEVKALHTHGGELYAGGYFEFAAQSSTWEHTTSLVKWTTAGWQSVDPYFLGWVFAIATWGDRLVVGSAGISVGGKRSSVLAWDGSQWSDLGGPIEGYTAALTEWQGAVVAAGGLRLPGQQSWSGVAINHGQGWSILGEPLVTNQNQSTVLDVATFRGDLYVAGWPLGAAAGVSSIMRWSGTRWEPVPGAPRTAVKCLLARPDGLWVGLAHNFNGSAVWRWDGDRWTEMTGLSGEVFSLVEHENDVFAGGALLANGNTTLARWRGGADPDGDPFISTWTPIEDGPSTAVAAMASIGNDLWVGGWFTRLGKEQAEAVARWTSDASPPRIAGASISSWPNPARERLDFRFMVPQSGRVTLTLYDLHGAKVATVVDEDLSIGPVDRSWSIPPGRVPAGIYFARLQAPGVSANAKVVVAR